MNEKKCWLNVVLAHAEACASRDVLPEYCSIGTIYCAAWAYLKDWDESQKLAREASSYYVEFSHQHGDSVKPEAMRSFIYERCMRKIKCRSDDKSEELRAFVENNVILLEMGVGVNRSKECAEYLMKKRLGCAEVMELNSCLRVCRSGGGVDRLVSLLSAMEGPSNDSLYMKTILEFVAR